MYNRKCLYPTTTRVRYAFLNRLSDFNKIWYRDILDLGEEESLHFVSIKVNKRCNPGKFSNGDFEMIIIVIIFFLYI